MGAVLFRSLRDVVHLEPRDAELLLSTLEWGGKGSDPEKVQWFASPHAKALLKRNDWLDLPVVMPGLPEDARNYILSCMPKWSRDLLTHHMKELGPDRADPGLAEGRILEIANAMVAGGIITLKPGWRDRLKPGS